MILPVDGLLNPGRLGRFSGAGALEFPSVEVDDCIGFLGIPPLETDGLALPIFILPTFPPVKSITTLLLPLGAGGGPDGGGGLFFFFIVSAILLCFSRISAALLLLDMMGRDGQKFDRYDIFSFSPRAFFY